MIKVNVWRQYSDNSIILTTIWYMYRHIILHVVQFILVFYFVCVIIWHDELQMCHSQIIFIPNFQRHSKVMCYFQGNIGFCNSKCRLWLLRTFCVLLLRVRWCILFKCLVHWTLLSAAAYDACPASFRKFNWYLKCINCIDLERRGPPDSQWQMIENEAV